MDRVGRSSRNDRCEDRHDEGRHVRPLPYRRPPPARPLYAGCRRDLHAASCPPEPDGKAFAPNRILEVTPEFLEAVLDQVEDGGARRRRRSTRRRCRLKEGDGRPLRLLHLRRRLSRQFQERLSHLQAPRTCRSPSTSRPTTLWPRRAMVDRARGDRRAAPTRSSFAGTAQLWHLPTRRSQEKWRSYEQIYWWLRSARRGDAAPDRAHARRAL